MTRPLDDPSGRVDRQADDGGLFGLTTRRPVAILMIVVAVVVFGLVSYNRLSLDLMPDITYPTLTIRTEYPGAAPEEVENLVSRPIEEAVGVVDNLVDISSISKSELSDVVLEFSWGTDMSAATQDVREKLDPVYFPDGVGKPIILRYDPSMDPVMRLGVYGTDDLYLLRKICDEDVKRDLEGIPGVAAVKVKGGLEEEIRVELDEKRLASLGIDIGTVNQRLSGENINLAGGKLKEGEAEYLVRTFNEFKDLDEIGDVVIGRLNGVSVRVSDLGRVVRGHKEREVITRVDGRESVEIEIYKEADANAVEVARRVREAVYGTQKQRAFVREMKEAPTGAPEEEGGGTSGDGKGEYRGRGKGARSELRDIKRKRAYDEALRDEMTDFLTYRLPEGIDVVTLSDQSVFIENSVDEVRNTALIGGLLAVVVLFLFLRRLTTTLIVGVSIPVSIVATFACMHIAGVSLNIMSLGGLALGVGMLVDNSIVVIESIFRCREEGDGVVQSALRGVREVSGAVTASTLTTIAVFFPIVFVEGIAGQVFGDMSLTVVFALLMSLAVSLFVIPMLASRRIEEAAGDGLRDRLGRSHILRFHVLEGRGPEESRPEGPQPADAGKRMALSVLFLGELAGKILRLLGTAGELVVKAAAGLLLPILLLFRLLPSRRFRGLPDSWTRRLGEDRGLLLGRYAGVGSAWEGILAFRSQEDFLRGIEVLRRFFSAGRGSEENTAIRVAVRGLAVLLFLPGLLYILLRYLFQHLFTVIGKACLLVVLAAIVLVESIFFMLAALLRPLVTLVLRGFDLGYGWLSGTYPRVLRSAIDHPGSVALAAGVPFVVSLFVLLPRLGRELIPEVHRGEFNIDVSMPVGTPLVRTLDAVEPVEDLVLSRDEVDEVATVVGVEKKSNPSAEEGENTAKLTVMLNGGGGMVEEEERLIHYLRGRLSAIPDMEVKISRPSLFSFRTPVEVEIEGYDLGTLERISREVADRMAEVPGLSDVKAHIQRGYPEVQIRYDREQLARYGLSVFDVASMVRNKVLGDVATEYREEDREVDLRVRLRDSDKRSVEDLRRLVVNPGGEIPIPLSAVADVRVEEGPSEIRRVDQQRAALITANLDGLDLGSATRAISGILHGMAMPEDFIYHIGGQNREMETSMDSLLFAMMLAIFLVYVVMASQFESLVLPFVIIFTIPLALIGVVLALYALGISISVMVFIGLIMLVGIVVNNAIVLIDYINTLRGRGMAKVEAIVLGGKVRLRPILMTTATTVLGLLPMALGMGEGAEIRTPMAVTVIAGLISATLLTLIVIPTIYNLVARGD